MRRAQNQSERAEDFAPAAAAAEAGAGRARTAIAARVSPENPAGRIHRLSATTKGAQRRGGGVCPVDAAEGEFCNGRNEERDVPEASKGNEAAGEAEGESGEARRS